jgi:hypothetical protein
MKPMARVRKHPTANDILRKGGLGLLGVLMAIPIHIVLGYPCSNERASGSDMIDAQCFSCLCPQGTWVPWWLTSTEGNSCTGMVYGLTVKKERACGSYAYFAYIPGPPESAQAVTVWCDSAPYAGVCRGGACAGLMGTPGPMQEYLLLTSGDCLLPCP